MVCVSKRGAEVSVSASVSVVDGEDGRMEGWEARLLPKPAA